MTRLGIIGCGDIVHLYNGFSTPALQAKGLEVTALIDVNIENAKQFTQQFPNALVSSEIMLGNYSNSPFGQNSTMSFLLITGKPNKKPSAGGSSLVMAAIILI